MELGIILSVALFFIGLAVGIPIGWVFLGSTITGILVIGDSINFTATTYFSSLNSEILTAIGFFIFAGGLLSISGLAARIVKFSNVLVGKIRGGLISVAIVASVFLGALTGSSLPVISALVPILVPELEKYGYKKSYTTAVICSSGFLGYLIPPSVPAMIYCLVAQQSIAALFLSTIIPGLLLALGYIVLNFFIGEKNRDPVASIAQIDSELGKKTTLLAALKPALPAFGCPLLILVGIYGGIFTPSEAGAVAVVYTIIVGMFVYKDLKFKGIVDSIISTIGTLGMSAILLAGGAVLSRYFLRYGVAQAFAGGMLSLFHSKTMILLTINVFLLILGMFIDGIPILVMAVPLILPIAKELDLNLIHLGTMIVVNIGIGTMTPPFAISIFLGSRLSGVSASELIPTILKYCIFVAIPVLLLTTFIPALSCWLPSLVLGKNIVGMY